VRKTRKYIFRGVGVLLLLVLLYWAAMFVFFQVKKESIRQQLSSEISKVIRGDFTIQDLGVNFFSTFPNIALSLKNVEMKDSTWTVHHTSFLKAKKILCRINPFTLISGSVNVSKVVVEDATINAFTDKLGYTNEYLLSPKSKSKNKKQGFHLEEIALKNVHIIRSDSTKKKLYDIIFRKLKCDLNGNKSGYLLGLKMDAFVNQLAFNTNKGSFLKGKNLNGEFDLQFDTSSKQLHFEKIRVNADRERLILSGKFDFSPAKTFQLTVNSEKLRYSNGIALLPEKITRKLKLYDVDVPMNVSAEISGKLVFGDQPLVKVSTSARNARVSTPAGDFLHTSFNGNFSNAINDTLAHIDENSGLTFTDFTSTWEGISLSSKKIQITNLVNPFLRMDITSSTDLASLNNLLNSNSFDFNSGKISAKVNYAGALFSDTATSIVGELKIDEGVIVYSPRQLKLEQINGRFEFQNTDVVIKDLSALAQGNKVNINATIRNMVDLLSKDPSTLIVDADVTSPSIDLHSFTSLVGHRRQVQSARKGKFARIANKIDRFMEACSINTRLKAEKLKYNKFTASDVNANFSMNADAWNLRNVSLAHANGTIALSGTLTAKEKNFNVAAVRVDMNNVDVMRVFAAFDNFGLASLHSENLRGKLSSTMTLNAVLDDQSNLLPELLHGNIFLSLKQGELIDFDPIQKMAVFVLKKRDFSHVQFAELRDSFEINGSKLTIHKMEIQSNVLGLLVEGIYDIKGKATDLVVQVPLKYLKKRDPGYVPANEGLDAKKGVSIYVRARNADNGEIDFKYGIFKKKSILEKNQKKGNSIP